MMEIGIGDAERRAGGDVAHLDLAQKELTVGEDAHAVAIVAIDRDPSSLLGPLPPITNDPRWIQASMVKVCSWRAAGLPTSTPDALLASKLNA